MQTKIEPNENVSESTPDMNEESLDKIVEAQEELSKVKQNLKTSVDNVKNNLDTIVDNMAKNPSMVSRAADTWGEVSLAPKLGGGIMLSIIPLAAATAVGFTIPLIISGVTAFTYVTGTIILDEHHQCNKDILDKIKDGIHGLAGVLETTIGALDKIKEQLTLEINRFKKQNDELFTSVTAHKQQVDSLTLQVECYIATEQLLRIQKDTLEVSIQELELDTSEKSQKLEENLKELEQAKHDYQFSQTQLSDKVLELASVRQKMGLEVEKAKKIAVTLQGTVKTLSGTVIEDKTHRQQFHDRLDNFLSNTEVSYDQVAARVCAAEEELSRVKDSLNDSNMRYQELLDEQEELIERLRSLDQQINAVDLKPNLKLTEFLNSMGHFSNKPKAAPVELKDTNIPTV